MTQNNTLSLEEAKKLGGEVGKNMQPTLSNLPKKILYEEITRLCGLDAHHILRNIDALLEITYLKACKVQRAEDIEKGSTEQEKAGAFYNEIKKDFSRLITIVLCVAGQTMESTNAEFLNASTEATFNNKRYKITAEFKLEEILNPEAPLSDNQKSV